MERTLANYSNYIMKDTYLSAEQKQHGLKDINKINNAVIARKQLTEKLLDYEKKRNLYLNNVGLDTKTPTELRIIRKPFNIEMNKY